MSHQLQKQHSETTFIETSGGLLTDQLVRKLRDDAPSEDAVSPETFALGDAEYRSHSDLEDEIAERWDELKERWDTVSQNSEIFGMDTSTARSRLDHPLARGTRI